MKSYNSVEVDIAINSVVFRLVPMWRLLLWTYCIFYVVMMAAVYRTVLKPFALKLPGLCKCNGIHCSFGQCARPAEIHLHRGVHGKQCWGEITLHLFKM